MTAHDTVGHACPCHAAVSSVASRPILVRKNRTLKPRCNARMFRLPAKGNNRCGNARGGEGSFGSVLDTARSSSWSLVPPS